MLHALGQLSAPFDMLLILVLSFWKCILAVFKHPNCHVSVSIPFLGLENGRTLNSLPGGGHAGCPSQSDRLFSCSLACVPGC